MNTYYYHSDHLGSAQLITDNEGREYERIEYTPYGEYWTEKSRTEGILRSISFTSFAAQNSVSNRKVAAFTGKERDAETGLYYYGARYLDPRTSRWLSADPALGEYIPLAPVNAEAKKHNQNLPGGGIYNTVNFHLYHYAGIGQRSDSELQANNPVKYTDPTGRVQIAAERQFLMNSTRDMYQIGLNGEEERSIGQAGCAIACGSNFTATYTMSYQLSPVQINETYVKKGSMQWSLLAKDYGFKAEKFSGQFSKAIYDKQNQDPSKQYTTFINVNYDSAGHDHWVGVQGIETINGKDYIKISPTSQNDFAVDPEDLRGKQGWLRNSNGDILVPVDQTKEYVNFTRNNAI